MGFVAPDAAPVGNFSFGFNSAGQNGALAAGGGAATSSKDTSSSGSDSDSDSEEKPTPQAAPVAKPASSSDDTSSSDDSSSDSEDEKEEKKPALTPTAGNKKSDSSDDDSSSSSDSDSDSDDEEKPAPAQNAAPTSYQMNIYPPAPAAAQGAAVAPTPGAAPGVSPLDSEFVPRRVYVGGMPYTYTESQIYEFWEYCGAIESIDLLTFPDTGRFRGIAFITFAAEEGYTAALGCDGEACEGQTLKVQKCKWSAKDRRAAMMGQPAPAAGAAVQSPQGQYNNAVQEGNGTGIHSAVPPPGGVGLADGASPWQSLQGPASAPPPLRAPAPKTAGYDVAYVGNIAYEADEAAVRALFEPFGVTKVRLHTDKDTGKPKGFAHVHFKDEASMDAAISLNGTMLMGRQIRVGYAQPKKENTTA